MTSEFGIAVHAMVFLHHKGDMVSSEVPVSYTHLDVYKRQVQAFLHRRQRMKGGDALAGGYFLQQAVLQR